MEHTSHPLSPHTEMDDVIVVFGRAEEDNITLHLCSLEGRNEQRCDNMNKA